MGLILLNTHSYEAINASAGTPEHTLKHKHTLEAIKAAGGPAVLSAPTAVSVRRKGYNHSDLYSRASR